jgi:hypothetical protein
LRHFLLLTREETTVFAIFVVRQFVTKEPRQKRYGGAFSAQSEVDVELHEALQNLHFHRSHVPDQ